MDGVPGGASERGATWRFRAFCWRCVSHFPHALVETSDVSDVLGTAVGNRSWSPTSPTSPSNALKSWAAAVEVGIHAAAAIPMHLDGETVGVLDLYDADAHDWPDENLLAARWLADMATAYLLLISRLHSAETLATQLQHALDSRVVIEQAKGMLAERLDLDMARSFTTLRDHARNHNLRLNTVVHLAVTDTSRTRS